MIRSEMSDEKQKQHLADIPGDGITRFSMLGGSVRGSLLAGTRLAAQARANHGLGILESLVLSQALVGAGLLSSTLKEGNRIGIKMDCTGPVRGFSAEASWDGKVRGYLFSNTIVLDKALESFDLKPFIGEGTLSVTRKPPSGEPYTGHISLVHGRIAEDITEYFLRSEQIRTAMALSVHFDKRGAIAGAGGLFFQALPGAGDIDMEDTELRLRELPSLGTWFSQGFSRAELLSEWFSAFEVDVLAEDPVEFDCSCSKERFGSYLKTLGQAELEDMIRKGPFPMELRCHNCSSVYPFSREDLEALL
ncbi:Hsp33 family molecular chaperone HslO [Treponema sp. OttesenSCG-928-L16]|nr:Hsp33 family molecular chaperone HslO [Treponema sp. OttesenSCG-928-L16]